MSHEWHEEFKKAIISTTFFADESADESEKLEEWKAQMMALIAVGLGPASPEGVSLLVAIRKDALRAYRERKDLLEAQLVSVANDKVLDPSSASKIAAVKDMWAARQRQLIQDQQKRHRYDRHQERVLEREERLTKSDLERFAAERKAMSGYPGHRSAADDPDNF